MSVKKVVRMGDPVLLSAAEPVVKFNTRALSRLVNNLLDTMAKHDGAGLAAPQIGVGLQVVVFGLAANPRACSAGMSVSECVRVSDKKHG